MANRRRGRSGWILGIIVVLGLVWVGYWYAAHYVAETAIARLATTPASGRKIGCAEIALGGFPLRLDLRCTRGTYAGAGDQATAAVGGIVASAPLYWPGTVEATLDGPLTVNMPDLGVALTATWSSGAATAGAGIGGLNAAGASFTNLKAENSGTMAKVALTSVAADAASGSIAPAGGGSYTLIADAKQLALTRADGGALPILDVSASATAENVGSLGTDPARALLTWLRGTPSIALERVRIAASGAIVSASGTLSLSKQGLLSGSVLLRYNSIEGLHGLIEALKPDADKDKVEVALQGIRAMSKPVDSPDGPALQTTLTFTDGLIWLAIIPLPIDPIPPIRF